MRVSPRLRWPDSFSTSRLHLFALVAVAVAAAALLLATTRTWGLGVSYDSVVYVQASDSLSSIPLPQPRDNGGEPLYWLAPIYPLALKAIGGSYMGARFLNGLLLLVATLLIGAITWRSLGSRSGLAAGALYAFSPAVFATHLNLLAEPLYLVLATAALGLIAQRHPTLAGLTAAAAVLTRYAGLPLILTGAIVFRGRDRIRFLTWSIAPYLAWIVRNELVAGQTTGRQVRWHPPDWEVLERGLRTAGHLLWTDGHLPSITLPFGAAGLLLQLVAAAALVVALLRAERRNVPPLVVVGMIHAGLYCAFLAVTVSLFDAATPVDARLLVPVVPALVLTIAWLTRRTPVAALVLACALAVATLQQARTVSLYGLDYSGRIWSAATFDGVSLPSGDLHSNWPAAVAYFTGRSPQRLPRPADTHTLAANPHYRGQLESLARAVARGKTTLVILDNDFLQIPRRGAPITETAPFKRLCHPATRIVTLCGVPHRVDRRGSGGGNGAGSGAG